MTADAEIALVENQPVVDALVDLLDLEPVDQDVFLGRSPQISLQRVFGGQVAGQALVAAARTVDADRPVHSLHSYFIRPGDPTVPIRYQVDRVRDGQSFTTRRVIAVQHDKAIFVLAASFQLAQGGIDHQLRMPGVPAPETLPTLQDRYEGYEELVSFYARLPKPFDIRYVDDPPWIQRSHGPREHAPHRVWMRAAGSLPDDPVLHVCVLTFASDLTLLDSVLIHHGLAAAIDPVKTASLDHAMWFHRRFRADEWFLYVTNSPSASGGRGLAEGKIFARDGRHIASVVQEGMLRVPSA